MIPVERLRQIKLFEPLEVETLAQIAPLFHRVTYRLGDEIFAQGTPGDAFYILDSGVLRVWKVDAQGQPQIIEYYQPPRSFGETSLLTGIYHDVSVDVFSATADLFVLTKEEWDAFLAKHPDIQKQLHIRQDIRQKLSAPRFPWLGRGEYVIVHTRRHPFALVLMLRFPAMVTAFFLLLALLVSGLTMLVGEQLPFLTSVDMLLWGVCVVWSIGAFGWTILDWSNDYLIVTNRRVVHFERVIGLFEEREEAPIEQVSNVNETAQGIIARVLGFNDIRIETAGHQVDINFSYVPRHLRVCEKIFEEIEHVHGRTKAEQLEKRRAEIRTHLRRLLAPPQVGIAAPTSVVPALGAPSPVPIQQRRRSALGKRLNAWWGLQIEEQGKITWRKHWLDLFGRTGKWLGMWLLVALGGPLIFFATGGTAFDLAHLAYIALWLIVFGIFGGITWWHYEDWRNDIYQLTDESVLDIERSPFRLKERSVTTTLDRIQNVSYNKPNLLANLFNFGDVIIETAGGQGRLVFRRVPNPAWATQEIFRRREARRERQQQEQVQRSQTDVLDWFWEYHLLLQQQGDVRVLPAQPPLSSAMTPAAEEPPPSSTP